MTAANLAEFSLHELFRMEAEGQIEALTAGLLALEQNPHAAAELEACMRAAHSLKGAARIVGIDDGVAAAHAMEELFVAAQDGRAALDAPRINHLLKGVDLLAAISAEPEGRDGGTRSAEVGRYLADLDALLAGETVPSRDLAVAAQPLPPAPASTAPPPPTATDAAVTVVVEPEPGQRTLRVGADSLNRLVNLAGEVLVASRQLKPFTASLARLKKPLRGALAAVEDARQLAVQGAAPDLAGRLADAERQLRACRTALADRLAELDAVDHRGAVLAQNLYDQSRLVRMRPFREGVSALPRMVRDVGRTLGKSVRLDIAGKATAVDRDILERLEAPLGHLLRNAVDHGIESPEERAAAGKPPEATIRLEAHHKAGKLLIVVADDGRGVDLERVRAAVLKRRLVSEEAAARLSEAELLDFLFLPGFTLRTGVTDISGRGVGLDVVHEMVKQVGGVVRVSSRHGHGTAFELQLPLTLSVIHALLMEIGGEPYAIGFANIMRVVKLAPDDIEVMQGRQYFTLEGRAIGLVAASQILGVAGAAAAADAALPVVVLGGPQLAFGLAVDRLLGGRELIVHPLDPRLGKIKDVSAGALTEDGAPLLVLDVEDLLRSAEKLAAQARIETVGAPERDRAEVAAQVRKRILVVDDSLTVRELQRKLLDHHGYEVEVAVDGVDGWNALAAGRFDLVVTDVDMPRLDGIALVSRIRADPKLATLPVLILSYKDREDDRRRGLEAGADYYLTKGSYHGDALLAAVVDLIGEAGR